MLKNKIATCFIKNKAYRIGEYAFLVNQGEIKNYKEFKDRRLKILSLYYVNDEEMRNPKFYALVEDDRGICFDVKVENLEKFEANTEDSLKYSFSKSMFNFKAYETLSGEIKYFISDSFNELLVINNN